VDQALGLQQGFAMAIVGIAKTIPPTVTVDQRAKVAGAVPHMEEVAARWTAVLADDDKITAATRLAWFYESLSLWVEAERCKLRSIEICKTELGDRHPDTATSLNNLAVLYYHMKQFEQALPLLEQALDIWHKVLPPGHPDILGTQRSLENLRRVMGVKSTGNS
jgi:tetratricopeptide (TPR) repeat protein